MDDIVKQAMAKWPNVPHCYGWLALDARGSWRMRDEGAQAQQLKGDKITNPALIHFINRNYLHDETGCWYFQNGPQRVYVDLEVTPFVVRIDSGLNLVLHTGEPMTAVQAAWLTEIGQLILQNAEKAALLDDRDLEQCLSRLKINGITANEDQILAWLSGSVTGTGTDSLRLELNGVQVPVGHILTEELPSRFSYVKQPRPR